MLSDALSEQYAQHGSWAFLRNNDRFIFQLLRTFERDNDDRSPPGHAMKPDAAPDGPPPDGPPDGPRPRPEMPPHGWRTMFWVVDQSGRVLVGPRERVPEDGTQRSIVVNGAEVGKVIASPVERLTRNTDINFDRQQKRTSWLIVALATLLAALATFPLARGLLAPVKRLVEGTHKLAAGDFSTRVTVTGGDELGRLAQDFNQLASTLERNQQMRRDLMADISHELRTPLAVLRGELEAIQDGVRRFTPSRFLLCRPRWLPSPSWSTISISCRCPTRGAGLPENLAGYHHPAGSGGGRFSRALRQPAAKHSGVAPGAGDDLRRPRPPDAALQQSAGEQPALYRQRRQPAHHRPPQRPDAGD